jgi:DHA2 family multidrug resistance protein
MATSLDALIACRVLQGLAGGGLQPSSQGVLLDAFPREQQGTAQTLCGMAALLAPVVGPTLGGFITDNYGWRWIFYLNVPVGLLALALCRAVVVGWTRRTCKPSRPGCATSTSGSTRSACAC